MPLYLISPLILIKKEKKMVVKIMLFIWKISSYWSRFQDVILGRELRLTSRNAVIVKVYIMIIYILSLCRKVNNIQRRKGLNLSTKPLV